MSGFKGEIFKQGGGHHLLSRIQKTDVEYRKVQFLSLVKRARSSGTAYSLS
ncbi:hypothetical protein SEHO0A_02989 [Salmonella enterica subsp. houtenae str. ATCC BAA-1581]|nr:hypothetical protein SEHO0A_02989 [Salmonella enterica subsp. houtenae str. ATCC BAA-1581]ENZ85722.1 hypothetical protein D088_940115 [Salmonella enterica subsp. houtenae serovar 16:z4,z32:-- str. RKS3027]